MFSMLVVFTIWIKKFNALSEGSDKLNYALKNLLYKIKSTHTGRLHFDLFFKLRKANIFALYSTNSAMNHITYYKVVYRIPMPSEHHISQIQLNDMTIIAKGFQYYWEQDPV